MAMLTLTGVTPLNLAITGQDFKMATREGSAVVVEHGAMGYVELIEMKDGSLRPSLKAKLDEAEISDGVCMSLVLTFPVVGSFTLQLQTTGETRITDMYGYVAVMAAKDVVLSAETTDGKPAALDMSNVSRSVLVNKDASELAMSGGHPGTLGLEAPGTVRAGGIAVGGMGAKINGTLKISGIKFPRISTGRGAANGECF